MLPNPQAYLKDLPDPLRETKNKLHKLEDILMIVLCSLLSGINDWVGMEDFANDREDWFRRLNESNFQGDFTSIVETNCFRVM